MTEEKFLLRTVINPTVVENFGKSIKRVYPDFRSEKFTNGINKYLEALNFGDRIKLVKNKLYEHLPKDYPKAIQILLDALIPEIRGDELTGFDRFIIVPQCLYVSSYGLNHYEVSMNALYEMTKRFSAENDIRPFIEAYPEKTMRILEKWTSDKNVHVRRLVSEGTRPRLPLGRRLKMFIEDPEPVILLLTKLKNDPSLYVRRSVANNLNDISKDNPEIVVETLREWKKENSENIDRIISHSLRTLLKKGHKDALKLMGYPSDIDISVSGFTLDHTQLHKGETIGFSFVIHSSSKNVQNLMIDYAVHFMKANGKSAHKVFKLSKKSIGNGESIQLSGNYEFKEMTTRKHYPGRHEIEILINGRSYVKKEFELK